MRRIKSSIYLLTVLGFLCVFAQDLPIETKQVDTKPVETVVSESDETSVVNDIDDIQRLIALPGEQTEKTIKGPSKKQIVTMPQAKTKKNKKTDYLHYGTIVEIATSNQHTQSKVYVFPSNWMSPQEGPIDITQADYELRVGENPVNNTQCNSIGFQFFSLESSGKNSVVSYGDSCEICAYSTSVVGESYVGWGKNHNVIFPRPFHWYVSDKLVHTGSGNSIFVAHPSRQEVTSGKQLFKIINPENPSDKGPIYQGSDVWICSAAPEAKENDRVVIHESNDGSPWYVLELQNIVGTPEDIGVFTISEVVAKNVKGKAKTVYDRLIAQRIIKEPITPPDYYEKVSGFFVDCFAAKVGNSTKMYAIDTTGSLLSISIDKKIGATAVLASITDVNDKALHVISGVQHETCFLVVHKDTKKVYEQNSINGHFDAVPVTAGDVEIERVSCAKTLASAFALGYDTKPGTRPIYRYASGWIQETDGLDVSVGADGTVAIINGSGKPMIRNSKKSTWDNVGKSSPSLVKIIVESRMLMWGIDKEGVLWSLNKDVWKKSIRKDGKTVIGFVSGGATSSGLLLLIASSGDAYCKTILPKNIKKDTPKKVKTLGQIRKERIKRER
jgi:hypothetical protein